MLTDFNLALRSCVRVIYVKTQPIYMFGKLLMNLERFGTFSAPKHQLFAGILSCEMPMVEQKKALL